MIFLDGNYPGDVRGMGGVLYRCGEDETSEGNQ